MHIGTDETPTKREKKTRREQREKETGHTVDEAGKRQANTAAMAGTVGGGGSDECSSDDDDADEAIYDASAALRHPGTQSNPL